MRNNHQLPLLHSLCNILTIKDNCSTSIQHSLCNILPLKTHTFSGHLPVWHETMEWAPLIFLLLTCITSSLQVASVFALWHHLIACKNYIKPLPASYCLQKLHQALLAYPHIATRSMFYICPGFKAREQLSTCVYLMSTNSCSHCTSAVCSNAGLVGLLGPSLIK